MKPKKTLARRRRLFHDILDAVNVLTDLRQDIHILCSRIFNLHTVVGQLPADPAKAYLKGMNKVVEELQQLLRKPRKTMWQKQWEEEKQHRMEIIAKIQRRPKEATINLLPMPKEPEEVDRFLRMSTDAERAEKLDKKRIALLRKLKKCDTTTEGGKFEAQAIIAEIEENARSMKSLCIDMAIDWVGTLDKKAKKSPKGDVKPIPHSEYLMLTYNETTLKASAYRVSSTAEKIGKESLEKETKTRVIGVYKTWKEAARFGLDWESAPRFTVTEYTSGEVECCFDIDIS